MGIVLAFILVAIKLYSYSRLIFAIPVLWSVYGVVRILYIHTYTRTCMYTRNSKEYVSSRRSRPVQLESSFSHYARGRLAENLKIRRNTLVYGSVLAPVRSYGQR